MYVDRNAPRPPAQPVTDGLPWERRRWAIAAIFTALAMASLDTAIANIALPAISIDLHVTPAEAADIVVTGCHVEPPSVETSTPATTPPPESVAVPLIVTVLPFAIVAPEDGEVMAEVGAVVSAGSDA